MQNPIKKIESYVVPAQQNAMRLSDFAVGIFTTIPTKKGIKKAIQKGLVFIDNKPAYTADYIRGGEIIDLCEPIEEKQKPVIELDLTILYEDDFLAIVHKPAGIEVSANKKWTLEHALPYNLSVSTQADALHYPEAIHRLDYPTSGVLLVGKTRAAVIALNKLFEQRQIKKTYYAITIGAMQKVGECISPIDQKPSQSFYAVVDSVDSEKFEKLNLVKLSPHTGRKHQLRIHMAELGNPIFGDAEHGKQGFILKGQGLYLHAYSLEFIHPFTHEKIYITSDLPKKFKKIFAIENL